MDYSGASAYVYAKASGMLRKAFIGQNAVRLFTVKSLSELWEVVFGTAVPAVPEVMLANQIEYEAVRRVLSQYTHLLEAYSRPETFLIELLRRYDIENLKVLGAALSLGEREMPHIVDIGAYSVLNYGAWPDIKKITKNSPFSWYDHLSERQERQRLSYRLDVQEFRTLWKMLHAISDGTRQPLTDFYRRDYALKNMLWGLRLRVYYNMSREQVVDNLIYVGDAPGKSDPLCDLAMDILDRAVDSYDDWKEWRFVELLNPHEDGVVWKLDPMWVEQKIRLNETRLAKRMFHQYPMTAVSPAMFFQLKVQELRCIRAAVESLRLNADAEEAMYVAGISAGTQQ